MCAIAGLWNFSGKPAEPETLAGMIQMIRHRGPDDSGLQTYGNVGLAHARLSIIDVLGGHQPMSTLDGALTITFNGEIFNYIELRQELIARGHRFETNSDTEVILQQYLFKGEQCVEDFEGQWAFAIWDARERKLFLSRDRLGIRPLYYWNQQNTFLFASEMKAILSHPLVARELDVEGLNQIFTFWSTVSPKTIFRDIRELPPGHSLTVTDRGVREHRYWQLDFGDDSQRRALEKKKEEAICDELLSLLVDATRLRLRSDVPVGAYLSGGLDSSIITALIRGYTNAPLETFSVSFDDPEFDETPYQETVGEALGVTRNTVHCTTDAIGGIFPETIWHAEQPVLRTAPAPMFLLAQAVRQRGCKVVLTGEGADEMFGGYDLFKETKIRSFCSAQPESKVRPKLLSRLYPYLPGIQLQSTPYLQAFFRVSDTSSAFFSHLPRWDLTARLKMFFSEDTRAQLQAAVPFADVGAMLPADFANWSPFHRAQYLESTLLLPGYILSSQGDRVAMAHGVEGRCPFLDSKVVKFAAGLPLRLKMKVLNEKYILKRCARNLIPAVVAKRSKQPYRAPGAASFISSSGGPDYVADLLSPEQIRNNGVFDPRSVESLVHKFRKGKAIGAKDNMALVGILSTQLVVQQFIQRLGCINETRTAQVHH